MFFLFVENRPSKPITLLVKLFEVTWHHFLGLESDFMTHYPGKWSAGFLCRLTLLVAVNRHSNNEPSLACTLLPCDARGEMIQTLAC